MIMSWTLPALPGFTALGSTYAPWPVWSGSVANPVQLVRATGQEGRGQALAPGP